MTMTAPTPIPSLDDRQFGQLVDDAMAYVRAKGGSWDDLGAGDPGMVLLEVFAYLTDTLLFRLNRVPLKARREFVALLGHRVAPPAAATVTLQFTRQAGQTAKVTIPAGTPVSSAGAPSGEPVVFITERSISLDTDAAVDVVAHHCVQVEGERVGVTSGEAGQTMRLALAPVVLPTGHELDLVIGIEATAAELAARPEARSVDGRAFELWSVVESFNSTTASTRCVRVDRATGLISFAPSVRRPDPTGGLVGAATPMAAIPPAGREVRAWYRCKGGDRGNVAANTLTSLPGPLSQQATVTNPARAGGGRNGETLAEAVARAPEQFHEPRRAVTADDFEALACREAGIARARAITATEHWVHATPGTVDVRVVPSASSQTPPSLAELREVQHERLLTRVAATLSLAQPLGVRSVVQWADYKEVAVSMRVVVGRTEDPAGVKRRVEDRLRAALSPVATDASPHGWQFGQALRASNVYDIALREPGVRYADTVEMKLTEAPDGSVFALTPDHFQPNTWYASDREKLFRSENAGIGWEAVYAFNDAIVTRIVTAAERPGCVAVITNGVDGRSSNLYISTDCASTWHTQPLLGFSWDKDDAAHVIRDACWTPASAADDLIIATDRGLYRMKIGDQAPRPWVVDPADPDKGCWAVAISTASDATVEVAVAMHTKGGVWLNSPGLDDRFRNVGLANVDVRRLIVEPRGLRRFIWAPTFAVGDDPGTGCHRAELRQSGELGIEWTHFGQGWNGGICHDLAFVDDRVLAASEFNGVLVLDGTDPSKPWRPPSVGSSGLPLLENRRFYPTVAVRAAAGVALVGTGKGVFRTEDGVTFKETARRKVNDIVTIPPSWLLTSGPHNVTVEVER